MDFFGYSLSILVSLDNVLIEAIVTIVLGLLMILCYIYKRHVQENMTSMVTFQSTKAKQRLAIHSACKNPNCVRCQRYRQVQNRAQSKLPWILHDLKRQYSNEFLSMNPRIIDAIQQGEQSQQNNNSASRTQITDGDNSLWQKPTLLFVPNLLSQEIVTDLHHDTCQYLEGKPTRKIVLDALQRLEKQQTSSSLWTVNDSPKGHWEVFHIINQGTWNNLLTKNKIKDESFKNLLDLIRGIPGLMDNCLFSNVLISKIYSNTIIEPHCGPTNIRHRLQFVLKLPIIDSKFSHPRLSLFVGSNYEIEWNSENNVFVFDDSYVHSVIFTNDSKEVQGSRPSFEATNNANDHFNTKKQSFTRTVLIVDLWNPALTPLEQMLIQNLYPPLTTS